MNALPSDPDIQGIDRPTGYRFTYWAPGDYPKPVTFTVSYDESACHLPVPAPGWLAELAAAHRNCIDSEDGERRWGCTRPSGGVTS